MREQPVIIDADVASLYGVETKRVNEAVRNNPEKFPGDYMFELTELEVRDLRSKISSAKSPQKAGPCSATTTTRGRIRSELATTGRL